MYAIKQKACYRALSLLLVAVITCSLILTPNAAYAQSVLNLPVPGTMVMPTDAFVPVMLKGMTVYPDNPLKFDFIVDNGNTAIKEEALKDESSKLVKYFLASLTVPEKELWVNLSPNEKDRIIPEALGQTELGQDLLAQDYILKQLTASLMYPEDELGKKFWDKVYSQAREQYGTTDIPIDTFNKVWIIPQSASVYEHENTVYVTGSRLKVMSDADYQAASGKGLAESNHLDAKSQTLTSKVIKEIIIPAIEKEVNEGENFAPLRQIYQSLILAKWYKETLKDSILNQAYTDQNKIIGIENDDPAIKQKIYSQYMEAYKKGVYDYMREEYDTANREIVPRKYFSGGFKADVAMAIKKDAAAVAAQIKSVGDYSKVVVELEGKGKGIEEDNAMLGGPWTLRGAKKILNDSKNYSDEKVIVSINMIGEQRHMSNYDIKLLKRQLRNKNFHKVASKYLTNEQKIEGYVYVASNSLHAIEALGALKAIPQLQDVLPYGYSRYGNVEISKAAEKYLTDEQIYEGYLVGISRKLRSEVFEKALSVIKSPKRILIEYENLLKRIPKSTRMNPYSDTFIANNLLLQVLVLFKEGYGYEFNHIEEEGHYNRIEEQGHFERLGEEEWMQNPFGMGEGSLVRWPVGENEPGEDVWITDAPAHDVWVVDVPEKIEIVRGEKLEDTAMVVEDFEIEEDNAMTTSSKKIVDYVTVPTSGGTGYDGYDKYAIAEDGSRYLIESQAPIVGPSSSGPERFPLPWEADDEAMITAAVVMEILVANKYWVAGVGTAAVGVSVAIAKVLSTRPWAGTVKGAREIIRYPMRYSIEKVEKAINTIASGEGFNSDDIRALQSFLGIKNIQLRQLAEEHLSDEQKVEGYTKALPAEFAIDALGALGGEKTIKALQGLLSSYDSRVRKQAEKYLREAHKVEGYIAALPEEFALQRLSLLLGDKEVARLVPTLSVEVIAGIQKHLSSYEESIRNFVEKFLTDEQKTEGYISSLPREFAIKRLIELSPINKKAKVLKEIYDEILFLTQRKDIGNVVYYKARIGEYVKIASDLLKKGYYPEVRFQKKETHKEWRNEKGHYEPQGYLTYSDPNHFSGGPGGEHGVYPDVWVETGPDKWIIDQREGYYDVVDVFQKLEIVRGEKLNDDAMTTQEKNPGGIDMNEIPVDHQGKGADIKFDTSVIHETLMNVEGFTPVIINITPIQSIYPLLGLAVPGQEQNANISQGLSEADEPQGKVEVL